MKKYAQINAAGLCVGVSELAGEVLANNMVEIEAFDVSMIGKQWDGAAWQAVAPTAKELAAAELQAIDAATGMTRTLREVLIAIGTKTGADVAFLAGKEAAAAAARGRLK